MKKDTCALGKLCHSLTRSEKKRNAIRDAAVKIFMDQGFEVASMDKIAAEAGVSKRTVYSHFGSKEELFAEIMKNICTIKRDDLDVKPDHSLPLEECLTRLGITFLHMLHYHGSLPLFRVLIAQAETNPGHGEDFMAQGPKITSELLANYLRERLAAGEVVVEEPIEEAAQSFFSALFGARYLNCLITAAPPPCEAEIEKIVKGVVQRFLYGIVPRK
ncbi:TetR/AcrR family transcriptional regulator [Kiloniella laminariae]|uniref:TetR/AcrR family transcriptional regulator n=1 Tax=Kiloniella laminariae TaxID=454162 RepID=A0ABT4LEN9_9PROT|nr:TetR/AcrR family transcriptional regulator [Kiloniella laminariae]MCZ4279549.1 TetR/AcrR family transcriptional regulator [Kiloniella laminariae]